MHHFAYRNGVLHAENVSLPALSAAVGTPFYCYSSATIERHFAAFATAVGPKARVFYAMKANSNLAVLKTLAKLGAGADTVSEGEIRRALAAGIPADGIVFSGVGKSDQELAFAVDTGIYQVNVETEDELHALSRIAAAKGRRQSAVIRINPDVGAGGHAKITTGSTENKFGVSIAEAARLYDNAANMRRRAHAGPRRPHRQPDPRAQRTRSGIHPHGRAGRRDCAATATPSSGSISAAASAFPTRWRRRSATART